MIKNSKKEYLTFLGLLTLGLFSFSPVNAEPPEEMRLDLTFQHAFHEDVTQVKFECLLEGWIVENGVRMRERNVASAEAIFPRPIAAIESATPTEVSIFFEPIVDNFELDRWPNYVCEAFVRSDDQDWIGISAGRNTPSIARVSSDMGAGHTMSALGQRNLRIRGSLSGKDPIRD